MDELMNEAYQENLEEVFKSNADPNGSYTGTCLEEDEEAVQDADDL